jgi:NADH:ubiquinone oxidoreductase subunit E
MTETSRIVICMGSSCFARGNKEHLPVIEQFLAEHGITAEVQLCGSRCEDECALGPNIAIDGVWHFGVDRGVLIDLLNHHFLDTAEM